jgi:CRP/FNR family transcriptional regulator, cyclic AMP receptor protein
MDLGSTRAGTPVASRHRSGLESAGTAVGRSNRRIVRRNAVGVTATVEQLSNVPLFSGCSAKELNLIARAVKEVNHREGRVIAREGEPGIGLFVIVDGTAKVTIGGQLKTKLGPGDFFGEIALLDGGPRTATVTATSDIKLIGLTEWVFRGLLQEHPSIAMKTLQGLASRLRNASKSATA